MMPRRSKRSASCAAGAALPGAQGLGFRARAAQVEQVAHRGDQARIVPGLGHVVSSSGAHQLDRGLQVRPGGEQDDRQLRCSGAQLPEQRHPFRAARGLAAEVHVLDDQVAARPIAPGRGPAAAEPAPSTRAPCKRQQHLERGAHRLAVVDDHNGMAGEVHAAGCALMHGRMLAPVIGARTAVAGPRLTPCGWQPTGTPPRRAAPAARRPAGRCPTGPVRRPPGNRG